MTVNYEQLAATYSKHRSSDDAIVQSLLAHFPFSEHSRVLEVGAGTENYSAALHDATPCSFTLVDPSPAMLDVAHQRQPSFSTLVASAEQLPFQAGSFDLVFCVDIVHHLDDVGAFFAEAFRVLSPSGQLLVATDSEQIIPTRFPLAEYFPETADVDLDRYPTLSGLRQLAEQAGFSLGPEALVSSELPLLSPDAYRSKALSVLHLISDAAFQSGIQRLEADLKRGPLQALWRSALLWFLVPSPSQSDDVD